MTTKGSATGRSKSAAKTSDSGDAQEPILSAGDEGTGVLDGSEGSQVSGALEGVLIGNDGSSLAGDEGDLVGNNGSGLAGDDGALVGNNDNAGTEGTGVLEGGDLADKIEVLISNNSVGGHEILRENGKILAIDGYCKGLSISTTREELVAIQAALADKPWVEITLKPEGE
ncbi:hypothetical protein PL84_03835 [Vibrio anguillarum]|uniref:hypothetical protein n=1 Tax=Vibrio anguillarum TaxID=55601 RepID=UPI00097E3652|nr:hypothetical protein [Vibrio anguillarum]MBT2909712.1 hypothetical protein [Vibrio anguillarum]MBT2942437.1 hypothetical protein [Vibrio anguillarum]MBT2950739.1 hypothetical protein [Vibrio anguillarum]MBT2979432.1 hypothetical protein [Vibrio anguillarum]